PFPLPVQSYRNRGWTLSNRPSLSSFLVITPFHRHVFIKMSE
ncbi:hypothetical protein PRIPAC_75463, partial [Pristionchus pacificus]